MPTVNRRLQAKKDAESRARWNEIMRSYNENYARQDARLAEFRAKSNYPAIGPFDVQKSHSDRYAVAPDLLSTMGMKKNRPPTKSSDVLVSKGMMDSSREELKAEIRTASVRASAESKRLESL